MRDVADSSSADTASHADGVWRGATDPVQSDLTAVLEGLPLPARGSAARAWVKFASAQEDEWTPPPAEMPLAENRDVHPSISRLLKVVASDALRVWHEGYAEDEVEVET